MMLTLGLDERAVDLDRLEERLALPERVQDVGPLLERLGR